MEMLTRPYSTLPAPPRTIKTYRAPSSDKPYVRGHPTPGSLIVTAAHQKSATSTISTTDKESKRLDASVAVKAANSAFLMAHYKHDLWARMEQILKYLPDDKQADAKKLLEEGKLASKHLTRTSADVVDITARSMAMALSWRRHAWFRISGFHSEVKD